MVNIPEICGNPRTQRRFFSLGKSLNHAAGFFFSKPGLPTKGWSRQKIYQFQRNRFVVHSVCAPQGKLWKKKITKLECERLWHLWPKRATSPTNYSYDDEQTGNNRPAIGRWCRVLAPFHLGTRVKIARICGCYRRSVADCSGITLGFWRSIGVEFRVDHPTCFWGNV